MAYNENHARAVFLGALERPSGDWDGYLELTCGSDAEIRARVEELLHAHAAMGDIRADVGHVAVVPEATPGSEGPGTVIGPYRLLEKIGEGGFGIVYMAEQTHPVRRKVALKIVKPGMDTRQVIARFEAERQALALMDHPNIAQVFDGGTTATGRPYFVMELVRGTPITVFCDQNMLSVRQRIELFLTVCQAVQHAHQKGIIHRDLKPSNVMVTLHDDQQVIKVIDFGIAKAVGQQLTEKTLFTNFAQMIGTPPYMSPEQAQMSGLDVDTRSDIYAMGVLLYELLTGTTPFDQERLRTVAFDEIRRIIREEEPPRPSTRLSALSEAATTASQKRGSDPRHLSQLLRGELDWIVMKCLEKERNRRYETANGLALDLGRYLRHEPVEACPPSLAYRTRTFVRRNQRSLTTAGLLVMIAAIGGTLTVWQAIRAASERASAAQARLALSATKQRAAEDRANAIAQDLERLNTANSLIESGRIHASFGEWTQAEADLSAAVAIRPDHSSGWLTRGDKYARLGLWDLAAADFQRAYQLQEPGSLSALYLHALLRFAVGDIADYRKICARMAARFSEPSDPRVCDEMLRACSLVDDPAIPPDHLVQLAEGIVSSGANPTALVGLGTAYYRTGRYESALETLADAEARAGSAQWDSTSADSVMAMAHHRLARPDLARKDLERASAAVGRRLHARSESLRGTLNEQWWYDAQANALYREAKTLIEGHEPSDDVRFWISRGDSLAALGRNPEAIESFGRAISLDGKLVAAYARRAELHARVGNWEKLLRDYERLWELQPEQDQANNALAWQLATCPDARYHDPSRAVKLAEKAVALSPRVQSFWNTLGIARYRAGDWNGSNRALLKSMELSLGRDPSDWLFLAMVQWRLEQKARAQQLIAHAVQRVSKTASEELRRFRAEATALIGQPEASFVKPATQLVEDPSAYTLLLEIDPDAAWVFGRRGEACAFLHQWDQAAADFSRVAKREPGNPWHWYGAADARLGAHDLDGFRRVRSDTLAQLVGLTDPTGVNHILYMCVVLPAECGEADAMLRMAKLGGHMASGNARVRAAVNYRAGRYEDAIRDLNESGRGFPFRAWDWLFFAMAQQQLGQTDQARVAIKNAEEWIARANKNRNSGSGLVWISWYESLEVEQLLGEAKALIR